MKQIRKHIRINEERGIIIKGYVEASKISMTAITMPIPAVRICKENNGKVAESRRGALAKHEAANGITIKITANFEGTTAKGQGSSGANLPVSKGIEEADLIFITA